jgi:uncharacterized damage-inducible protein DinB
MTIDKPQPAEFNAFYAGYIGKVMERGPVGLLEDQVHTFEKLRVLSDADAGYRYAEGKWTVKELLGHVCDTERLFSYRLLHIARGDASPLAGMDENAWNAIALHDRRAIADVAGEMIAVRRATVALVASLDATALARTGVANKNPISARALVWILPGHAQHHLDVLRDRYAITL